MLALATEPTSAPYSELYAERFDLPPKPTLQTALEALVKKELVARGGDREYRIVEPFLADWLVREQERR